MRIRISFTKMSGAGNDFVVIDNTNESIPVENSKLAYALCSRRTGVGADGLLMLEPSQKADFAMRYYNADGSSGGMCGNGGRCVARFAVLNQISEANLRFEALDYVYSARVSKNAVILQMKPPILLKKDILVTADDIRAKGCFINTGSPHFVTQTDEIESADVELIGRTIRHHRIFSPEGCNVNFIQRVGEKRFKIRTYERGVEAETLACGTGSVASAIIMSLVHDIESPITLDVRSGEQLIVRFVRNAETFSDVTLEGSAHFIFTGSLFYDLATNTIVDYSAGISQ